MGPISSRLQGIVDALTKRTATLIAVDARARLTPASIDLLRAWIAVAVRGAALEGARCADQTRAELLPVPLGGVASNRDMAITAHNTGFDRIPKLPGGV